MKTREFATVIHQKEIASGINSLLLYTEKIAKEAVPDRVRAAYECVPLAFGADYILPKPLDPRLLTAVAPAVARGAMESGVATRPITDWDGYSSRLRQIVDSKPAACRLM